VQSATPIAPKNPVYNLVFSLNLCEESMRTLTQKFVNFLKKEDGPTAVEYAVMLALIIVVCIAAITTLGSNANNTFSTVANKVAPVAS